MAAPRRFAASALLATLCLAGCGKSSTAPTAGFDARPLLKNVSHLVVAPTYAELAASANALAAALEALRTNPTEPTLATARASWRDARAPWEASESFLYGPASDREIDPALDSWPVNQVDVQAVLASGIALTPQSVAALSPEVQGFHTIELLLFGEGGARTAASLTVRELDYLAAAGSALSTRSVELAMAWNPAGEDFGRALYGPGAANGRYRTQADAVSEVLGGMAGIAEELAESKIGPAYDAGDPALEESRYSANSLADFRENLASIRNVYQGSVNGSEGAGLAQLVQAFDPDVDLQVRAKLVAAQVAVDAIPGTFSSAIVTHRPEVSAARDAVRELRRVLDEEVRPLLSRLP